MTIQKACSILGISGEIDKAELKKKYRALMRKVHPDTKAFTDGKSLFPYTAQEINEAYEILSKKSGKSLKQEKDKQTKREKQGYQWNAPVNPNAYREREILHSVESADGEILGDIVIARDKYFWTLEEEFSLFLKSVFSCSLQLLDEIDEALHREVSKEKRLNYQAELSYLLAQQFINIRETLKHLANEKVVEDASIFYIPAMLEKGDTGMAIPEGSYLHPAGVKQHRLLLMTADRKKAGYLSFKDDRLYYILIPLIEQKRVLLKTVIAKEKMTDLGKKKRRNKGYQELDFWVKIPNHLIATYPESLAIKIDEIRQAYEETNF